MEKVRQPKQMRSIQTKEKILETALALFCKKGYFKTTTNEIAKTAGVSIGSLYAYFKDQDTIFMEILERHHQQFVALHNEAIKKISAEKKDIRVWLENITENLIAIHETSIEFNRELNVLYYSNPAVAAIMDQHREQSQRFVLEYFQHWKSRIKTDDLEATALVSFYFLDALVEQLVFRKNLISKKRLLRAGIDTLLRMLKE